MVADVAQSDVAGGSPRVPVVVSQPLDERASPRGGEECAALEASREDQVMPRQLVWAPWSNPVPTRCQSWDGTKSASSRPNPSALSVSAGSLQSPAGHGGAITPSFGLAAKLTQGRRFRAHSGSDCEERRSPGKHRAPSDLERDDREGRPAKTKAQAYQTAEADRRRKIWMQEAYAARLGGSMSGGLRRDSSEHSLRSSCPAPPEEVGSSFVRGSPRKSKSTGTLHSPSLREDGLLGSSAAFEDSSARFRRGAAHALGSHAPKLGNLSAAPLLTARDARSLSPIVGPLPTRPGAGSSLAVAHLQEDGRKALCGGGRPAALAQRAAVSRALALAKEWAATPAQPLGTPAVSYPNGVVVDLSRFAGKQLPWAVNGLQRARLGVDISSGEVAKGIFDAYLTVDEGRGHMTWSGGAIKEFVTLFFDRYALPPPPDGQLLQAYLLFDPSRTGVLDARHCLCLVDVLLRAALHRPDMHHRHSPSPEGRPGGRAAEVWNWTPQDVARWSVEVAGCPAEVGALLLAEEVHGPVLLSLTEADLEKLKVHPFGRRRRLQLGIERLRTAAGMGTLDATRSLPSAGMSNMDALDTSISWSEGPSTGLSTGVGFFESSDEECTLSASQKEAVAHDMIRDAPSLQWWNKGARGRNERQTLTQLPQAQLPEQHPAQPPSPPCQQQSQLQPPLPSLQSRLHPQAQDEPTPTAKTLSHAQSPSLEIADRGERVASLSSSCSLGQSQDAAREAWEAGRCSHLCISQRSASPRLRSVSPPVQRWAPTAAPSITLMPANTNPPSISSSTRTSALPQSSVSMRVSSSPSPTSGGLLAGCPPPVSFQRTLSPPRAARPR